MRPYEKFIRGCYQKLSWEESDYLLGRFTEKKIGHPIISYSKI